MALDKRYLDPTGSGSKGTRTFAIYQTTDNKAAVKGAGYFNGAARELERVALMLIIASDATFLAKVTVSSGTVTIAAPETYA